MQIGPACIKCNLARLLSKFISMYTWAQVDFFGLYYQEFNLRTHLQNLPSKMCMNEIPCYVVCRDQHLERASMSIMESWLAMGQGSRGGDQSTVDTKKRSYICIMILKNV